MSSFSEIQRSLLLNAMAQECHLMAAEIAELGELVTSGESGADLVIALQSFDYLAQQASAHAALASILARQAGPAEELMAVVDGIPLPAMRHRLLAILSREPPRDLHDRDEAEFWLDR